MRAFLGATFALAVVASEATCNADTQRESSSPAQTERCDGSVVRVANKGKLAVFREKTSVSVKNVGDVPLTRVVVAIFGVSKSGEVLRWGKAAFQGINGGRTLAPGDESSVVSTTNLVETKPNTVSFEHMLRVKRYQCQVLRAVREAGDSWTNELVRNRLIEAIIESPYP